MSLITEKRWYQLEAEQSIFDYYAKHGMQFDETGAPMQANPVIIMPTGTGKSFVIAGIIQRILQQWPNQRFLQLVHDKKLIQQNYDELKAIWPQAPAGIYSSGLRRKDTANQIIFGGIKSVANNVGAFGWRDIIIIDECHLVGPDDDTEYQAVLAAFRAINPWVRVIGLSATAFRMGLGMITDNGIFTHVCYDLSGIEAFARLIREGYLVRLIPKPTATQLDVSNVRLVGQNGDFVSGELQKAVDTEEITHAAMLETCEYGYNRHSWLVFAAGVEHSEHCAEKLRSFGVEAAAIHSKLKGTEANARFAAFTSGRLRAICGNNIFTTGFNHKPIDLIAMVRPTASTSLWVQMLGRGTRPFSGDTYFPPKENCLVLDFAGNTRRLGPIDDPVIPKRKGAGNGDAPCCICSECNTYNHARASICIGCGAEITHAPKIVETASTEALLSSDAPIYDWFPVLYRHCSAHHKLGQPSTLKVTYNCGIRSFVEWVAIERTGFLGKMARDWWRKFSPHEPPTTVAEALARHNELAVPAQICVWLNRKYPEVVNHSSEHKQ